MDRSKANVLAVLLSDETTRRVGAPVSGPVDLTAGPGPGAGRETTTTTPPPLLPPHLDGFNRFLKLPLTR
ncbi:hypothetical protein F2P81_018795 [Scophthalmus maximus]|uniref:Uncharacterized protein n=1 Tax=Scophthalmus maximus TaxID=52904 RepID=A0A6A4SD35_SCOMX|nr:hypothetical protein F2P81_018795 [Scophthalmus maximus]